MHLIHKQDHITVSADLVQHIPKPLFKFTAVLGSGHQVGHIQADQPLVFQLRRYVSCGHSLRQTFGNGRFPHPRFPNKGRIVLVFPAQNPDHRVNFPIPCNHRLHRRCLHDQIFAVLIQQFRTRPLLFPFFGSQFLPLQRFHCSGKQFIRVNAAESEQFPRVCSPAACN